MGRIGAMNTLAALLTTIAIVGCAPSPETNSILASPTTDNAKNAGQRTAPIKELIVLRRSKYGTVTMGRRLNPPVQSGFRSDEEIILTRTSGVTGKRLVARAGTIEEIGAKYRLYSDGSGRVHLGDGPVEGWSIGCETDKITDERRCSITSYDAGILVGYTGQGEPRFACVVKHDFPGRVGALRVDRNEPIITNREGCIAGGKLRRFLAQMRSGSSTVARSVQWPYDYNRDATADDTPLFRYAEELLRFGVRNAARLSFSPENATIEEVGTRTRG